MQAAYSVRPRLYHSILFWLAWVLVTAVAATGGWFLSGAVGFVTLLIGLVFAGAIVGACLGAAQGWLLHHYDPGGLLPVWASWPLITALGGGAGFAVFAASLLFLGFNSPPQSSVSPWLLVIPPAVGVSLLATMQWLILRQVVSRALWWIPANWIGWGVGIYATAITIWPIFLEVSAGDDGPGLPRGYWLIFVGTTLTTVIANAITGLVLAYLLRHPRRRINE
jgi:hypothetical protein